MARRATRGVSLAVLDEREGKAEIAASGAGGGGSGKVLVTGCWATSHGPEARALPGVDAVLGHRDDLAGELDRLLAGWEAEAEPPSPVVAAVEEVRLPRRGVGTVSLPLLDARQSEHQRAFLKVQDGCDAHCTYCIIPSLRPNVWSKPEESAVAEARALVEAGHRELVLTGIFLGAYGQATALRRRQPDAAGRRPGEPLARLVQALCTRVPGLHRLRLSSLEPGDLSPDLLAALAGFPQVVPHFHLPLQSGSDCLLRRMNRQYCRDDYLRMIDRVTAAFDRPAVTTDIIVGFPGEGDAEFERTLEVVGHSRFIHVHAFPFSPRPGTAAARWAKDFVRGPIVNERIGRLRERAAEHSLAFRQGFVGEMVELLVERPSAEEGDSEALAGYQHGRCERYFAVHFESDRPRAGEAVRVKIERVTAGRTFGREV